MGVNPALFKIQEQREIMDLFKTVNRYTPWHSTDRVGHVVLKRDQMPSYLGHWPFKPARARDIQGNVDLAGRGTPASAEMQRDALRLPIRR